MLACSRTLDDLLQRTSCIQQRPFDGLRRDFLPKPYAFAVKERSFLQRLSQSGCLLSVTQELYYRLQEGANPPAS